MSLLCITDKTAFSQWRKKVKKSTENSLFISLHTIEHHKERKENKKKNEKSSLLDIKKGKNIFYFKKKEE